MPRRLAVTGNTGTYDLSMINRKRRRPVSRKFVMTQLALVSGQYMIGGFTTGIHAIMAINTTIDDGTMVHTGR